VGIKKAGAENRGEKMDFLAAKKRKNRKNEGFSTTNEHEWEWR
jgi:hypothetical protein